LRDKLIDCDEGRRLGCDTFCCRLIVRFDERERPPGENGAPAKGCVDKSPDGFCIHLDRAALRCKHRESRPRVCREYDCNTDYLSQVALRTGVKNMMQLSREALRVRILREDWIEIPGSSRACAGDPANLEKRNG
jgi:Fe-S-cluster containining protein